MKENGGAVINIIADMWKGFPGMRSGLLSVDACDYNIITGIIDKLIYVILF